MKKVSLVLAGIAVIVGLALFAGAFLAVGSDLSKLGTAIYETNTYPVDGAFHTIEIKTKESDVVFRPSEDGSCSVVCTERNKVFHTVSAENGILKISETDERAWFDHLTFFPKPVSITVNLPSAEYEALRIECSTGDVSLITPFTFEDVGIRTSTGDIRIEEICAGQIRLSVSTGKVELSSVSCIGTVSVRAGTGNMKLTDLTCQHAVLNSSTGDLTLKDVVASDTLTIESSTGGVRFENCDAARINVKTSTGDVTGTIRTEKIFTAKTSTGTVKVPDTASGGSCEITTSTGDIHITLSGS